MLLLIKKTFYSLDMMRKITTDIFLAYNKKSQRYCATKINKTTSIFCAITQ